MHHQKRLPRRAVLKGSGRTVALPFLDAMVPAGHAFAREAAAGSRKVRFVAMEMVHGAAGSTNFGHEAEPLGAGRRRRRLRPGPRRASRRSSPYRNYLTIVSNTDVRNAEAFIPPEIGGDHFRSAAVFLTQAHPHQTQGSDIHAGTSIDQIFAQKFGQDTAIPSMQLCIENVDQAGGCFYGYSCAYTDSISWAVADRAAADDSRPACSLRSALRRRRDAGGARPAPQARPQHPRLGHRFGRPVEGHARPGRPLHG